MQVVLVIAEQQRTRNAKFETREDGPTKRNSKTQPQKTRVGHPICKMPVSPRSRGSGFSNPPFLRLHASRLEPSASRHWPQRSSKVQLFAFQPSRLVPS